MAKREYLVIEDSAKKMVFPPGGEPKPDGYIPRDVVEAMGIDLSRKNTWFTAEQGTQMRAHPEWLDEWPLPEEGSRE